MGVGGLYLWLFLLCFLVVGALGGLAGVLYWWGRRQERLRRLERGPDAPSAD